MAEKASTKSQFYEIERKATKKLIKSVLLTGAPLSTFAKAGDYVTKISFSAFGNEDSVELPLKIVEKEFVSETIPLNESNTAIKTNVSKERSDQIKRLNAILDTKDFAAVYETKAFAPPTGFLPTVTEKAPQACTTELIMESPREMKSALVAGVKS